MLTWRPTWSSPAKSPSATEPPFGPGRFFGAISTKSQSDSAPMFKNAPLSTPLGPLPLVFTLSLSLSLLVLCLVAEKIVREKKKEFQGLSSHFNSRSCLFSDTFCV